MDNLLQLVIDMVGKFGTLPAITPIPWDKLYSMMNVVNPYLGKANSIFPVDSILYMLILLGGVRLVLLVLWTIKFIRDMMPF